MKDIKEQNRYFNYLKNKVQIEEENYAIMLLASIAAFILIAVFVYVRFDFDVDRVIDHALDIDTICADCGNTSEMCNQYWKAQKKCGF